MKGQVMKIVVHAQWIFFQAIKNEVMPFARKDMELEIKH